MTGDCFVFKFLRRCADGKMICVFKFPTLKRNENLLISLSTFFQAREKFEVSDDIKRLNPSDVANAVVYAVTQPAHCAVNEILVEPTDAPC